MTNHRPILAILLAAGATHAQDCIWTQVSAGATPPGRYDTAIAYDSSRQRIVVFGGRDSNNEKLGDTWEWDGAAWTLRSTTGPAARYGHALAYHSARARTVLFGGTPTDSKTWEWDGTQWAALPFTNTVIPSQASMAYDETYQRLIMFGGSNIGTNRPTRQFNATGEFSDVIVNGPPARIGTSMVYDPDRARLVMFGGYMENNLPVNDFADFSSANGSEWFYLAAGATPRYNGAMGYDPVRHRIVLCGGISRPSQQNFAYTILGDTWEFDPATGASVKRTEDGPDWRSGARMVYDAAHPGLHLFGGGSGPRIDFAPTFGDLWRFDGSHTTGVFILQRPPVNKIIVAGEAFSLSVTAQGASTYQWFRGSIPLVNDGRISGATTPKLFVNPSNLQDRALFTVKISAGCGTASAATTFTVSDPDCYTNCDHSTLSPMLNANDFQCFMNNYAAGTSYANCDGSTNIPILNANDFQCFLGHFAAGCDF